MFKKLFNPDNALMITMSQVTDCIFLSLFWVLGCFPLITVGASSTALYDAVYHGFRKGDKHSWVRFLRTFRSNLKASILPTVVYLAIIFAGAWLLIRVWNAAVWEQVSFAMFSAAAFLIMLVLGMLSVLFPLLSRFENSFSGLLRNTVLLSCQSAPDSGPGHAQRHQHFADSEVHLPAVFPARPGKLTFHAALRAHVQALYAQGNSRRCRIKRHLFYFTSWGTS